LVTDASEVAMTGRHMPVLVITGGFGKVGRMLIPRLSEAFRVHVIDRAAGTQAVPATRVTVGDVRDPAVLHRALRQADAVLHLAANPSPDAAWSEALGNVDSTHAVLAAAGEASIPHIAIASSVHAAGGHFRAGSLPVDPYDTPRPCCEYGAGKLAGEALARMHHDATGASVRVLRFGMTAADATTRESMYTWLGDRDAADLVTRALRAEPGFGIYHGVSQDAARYWAVDNATQDLGWLPQDALPLPTETLPPQGPTRCAMFAT